jgi:assimilatory nitrate reductase catalytic subunit
MGLNQSSSGTAKNAALIHLHLATGQIGKPGTGPFSLTGQPNAMGGREAGGMATLLPGHRDPNNAQHRAEIATLWRVPELPATPGHTAIDMFDAVLQGQIKVLWIAATNPAQSMPNQAVVRAALQKAEMVIVQEAFANTETLAYADLVLPAATWPEKEGTVTNSERRISRVHAAITPPGEALPDWKLVCAVAQKLAAHIAPHKAALFNYKDEAQIFAEHALTTAGRDLDYSTLDYAQLEAHGPQQWPYTKPTRRSVRLYQNGIFATPSQRAQFLDVGYTPVAESVSAHYPIRLTTGRLRDQWHTMSRTGLVPALTRHAEEPFIHLHPLDMQRFKLTNDVIVKVKSKRGHLILPAISDDTLKPGHGYIPMHWGSGFMAGDGVNALANNARDPVSHQPELKHSAVGIEVMKYEWHATGWIQGSISLLRQKLSKWLTAFPYAVILPTAIGHEGIRLRLAGPRPPQGAKLDELIHDLSLDQADLAFDDPARGLVRRILRHNDTIKAFLLAGDTRAHESLLQWADTGLAPENISHVLLGRVQAVTRARIVCTCESVSDQAIEQAIAQGDTLAQLKDKLKCGTSCGSCLPQIKQLIQRSNRLEHPA